MSKSIIVTIVLFLGLAVSFGVIQPAIAGVTDTMIDSLKPSSLVSSKEANIDVVVGRVIQAFLSLFGIIFLGLMIFGGYRWMMASGREEELTKAKGTIRAAIIGLAIVMSAYVVTFYVVSKIVDAGSPTQTSSGWKQSPPTVIPVTP